MAAVLLSVHVIAAIVFVGGSSVATSLFPRYVPVAPEGVQEGADDGRSRTVAAAMHRITRGYSIAAIIVPAAGIVLALLQGRMGELWIILSLVLTAAAGVLLAWQINPRQRAALAVPGARERLRPLTMLAGGYNLIWAVVAVLMITQPGG
ncbi:hypothetical protein GCM10022224_025810 [Nonomuraea antimicrobica]|uniref:Integral membrane protein n=1 Tax=Nonomuraea antimicrobica TaxID=561173 RepID=A0ABP7BJG0_9ACTN